MKLVYQALAQRLRARNRSVDARRLHEDACLEIARKYLPGPDVCDKLSLHFESSMREHCREEFTATLGKDFPTDRVSGARHYTEWHFTVHPKLTEPFELVVERDGPNHESFLDHEGDTAEVLEAALKKALLLEVPEAKAGGFLAVHCEGCQGWGSGDDDRCRGVKEVANG